MANIDCVGQDEISKENCTPSGVQFETDNYKEADYIEADNESHGGKIPCELFGVAEKDSDYIDIDDLY